MEMVWIIGYHKIMCIPLCMCVCEYTGVEGYSGNLEARRVRNAENKDDVDGVSKFLCFILKTITIANEKH